MSANCGADRAARTGPARTPAVMTNSGSLRAVSMRCKTLAAGETDRPPRRSEVECLVMARGARNSLRPGKHVALLWCGVLVVGLVTVVVAVLATDLRGRLVALGVVGMAALVCVPMILWDDRQRRKRIERHAPLSDDEFLRQMAVSPEDARLCLLVRAAVGEGYEGLPPEHVYPEDGVMKTANWASPTPFDWLAALLHLQKTLNISIPRRELETWGRNNLPDDYSKITNRQVVLCLMGLVRQRMHRQTH